MTVTELRQALQKLEAEGKGGLPVFVDVSSEYFYQPKTITVGTYVPGPGHDRVEAAIFDDTELGPYGDGFQALRDPQ